jgi:hypothetical protein
MVCTGPYSEIFKERQKEEILTVNTAGFLQKKARSSTRGFIMEVKSLHYTMVKNDKHRGHAVAQQELSVCVFNISK